MTSAVNVRSQLIPVIFIFVGVIVQCDASTSPGKVLDDEDFHSIVCLLALKLTHYITGTNNIGNLVSHC